MAKLRTYKWVQCQSFQHSIQRAPSPLLKICKVLDDTEHVINNCVIHEDDREMMLLKLNHPGRVTGLLASDEQNTIIELAKFLENISDRRKEIEKEEEAKELAKRAKEPAMKKPTKKPVVQNAAKPSAKKPATKKATKKPTAKKTAKKKLAVEKPVVKYAAKPAAKPAVKRQRKR